MKLGKKARKVVLFGGLALAMVGVGASVPAMADTLDGKDVTTLGTNECRGTVPGKMCFKHKGEWLGASDRAADGDTVQVQLKWNGKIRASVHAKGKGDVEWKNLSIKEGTGVYIRMVVHQPDGDEHPSGWIGAHA
ncbi:MAG: hypothetical protein ACRD0P_15815 [Stackebrandtia sp.]